MENAELDFNCRYCAKHIVHGPNAWHKLGKSSVTPADPDAMVEATNAFRLEDKTFAGASELENCILIKLLCGGTGCRKRLGLKCVRSNDPKKLGFV
jgi:hypothetical protein